MVQVAERRKKGVETRKALLDAAIAVIARDGLEGFSHRAVAGEAGASLALTTYYFASKQDLIEQAFERFVERGEPGLAFVWERAHEAVDRWRNGAGRRETIDQLADNAVAFIAQTNKPETDGVAFELAFLYQPRLSPRLAGQVRSYRKRILDAAETFCRRCGSLAPAADAELMIGLVLRLEFERLSVAMRPTRRHMKAQLVRLLDMILAEAP